MTVITKCLLCQIEHLSFYLMIMVVSFLLSQQTFFSFFNCMEWLEIIMELYNYLNSIKFLILWGINWKL